MGDHAHEKGKWMFSYKYMFMHMDGNRDGTDGLSTGDVLADFMVAPTSMDKSMHMPGVMYAPTQTTTLMAMFPYVRLSMDHKTRSGVDFTTESDGPGDIKLSSIHTVYMKGQNHVHITAGVSIPTGSIDEEDDTPAGADQKLPYTMQLGSGTFDVFPGITYLGQKNDWFWGGRALVTIRLGRNDNGYALGDRYSLTVWGAKRWLDWFSSSVRVEGKKWGNIEGQDDELNPAVVPTADPDRQGGERLDVLFGINAYSDKDKFGGHLLAIEGGLPIYQSLDGPQLEGDWLLSIGWQWTF
jgi:hypothetical protein